MNNEYVRELLYQESISELGYPPESGVKKDWYGGNDYYNDILVDRKNQTNRLESLIVELDEYAKSLPIDDPLKEVLYKRIEEIKARVEYLKIFGYESIKYTYETNGISNYPYLESKKKELAARFKYIYGNMRIAYNTAEQFNEHLQAKFDDIAPEYENRLRMQILYEKQILGNDHRLKDLDISDETTTNSVSDTFYFNEQEADVGRKALENTSNISTKSSTLQAQIKNLMSGYMLNQTVLKDYLNEFGVLFIRVWPDKTRW